jgi:hypothetical protein
MEELIATLMEGHTQQMENLVRLTTEALKEMTLLLKENKNSNINVVSILVTPVLVHKKEFLFLNSLKGFWRSLAEIS